MSTSRPGIQQSIFERSYRDRCELAFILLRDGQVYDLSEHAYQLQFFRTSFFHSPILAVDLIIFGSKISVVLTAEQKSLLREQDVLFALTRSDGTTLSEGTLSWKVRRDSKIFNPPDIIINFDTALGEILVKLGYLYVDGENVQIIENLTEEAKQARTGAVAARAGAENAESGAVSSRNGAATERLGAETARTGAENAESGAVSARNGAANERLGAETARTGAENAESGAVSARNGAATERLGAETARTGAENAESGAVAARNGAATERLGAETARTGAETALTGANTARTGAEAAQTGAQNARTGAEAARDEVNAAKDSFIRNSADVWGLKISQKVSLTAEEYNALPVKPSSIAYIVTTAPTPVILQSVSLTRTEHNSIGSEAEDPEVEYLIIEE